MKRLLGWLFLGMIAAPIAGTAGLTAETAAKKDSRKQNGKWPFKVPQRSRIPQVVGNHIVYNPIDAFLLANLESKGRTFSARADKTVLLRRLYMDLVGVPPSPKTIVRFLEDDHPDNYLRMVEQLLSTMRYGERWGRHWMDTAGYVDVRLFDGDAATVYPNEGMWRYRDYIIDSHNEDAPWDVFLTEQLAGDEIRDWRNDTLFTEETKRLLTATGYLRNIEDHTSEPQYGMKERYTVLFDLMEMVSTSLLGITMQCSRCHDHKFDPITQREYYQMMAFFETSYNVKEWLKPQDRWIPDVGLLRRMEIDQLNKQLDLQIEALSKQRDEQENVEPSSGDSAIPDQIKELESQKLQYGRIQALFNVGKSWESHVLIRGDYRQPGDVVYPDVIGSVTPSKHSNELPGHERLRFSRWITSRGNPFVSRVIVNRVWHHLLGNGIVTTLGNFGRNGSGPSHPELLDWLAVEFMDSGWSLKRLIRLIVTSYAYQQRSVRSDQNTNDEQDPENRWMAHANLRRLDSEVIRDAILVASGSVDREMGGPPVMLTTPVDGLSKVKRTVGSTAHQRRSVYLFQRRVYPLKFMEIFDSPVMPVNCTQRVHSNTVLQSFALLNSDFVVHHSRKMADRIIRNQPGNREAQIRLAYLITLSRYPSLDEQRLCLEFFDEQTENYRDQTAKIVNPERQPLNDLCHMLLCTNEFLYLE